MKIEDYGIIGDLHTVALVGRNGSIDWLCTPRFDSGACFAALLGGPENGAWCLSPEAPVLEIRRNYSGDSLILETEFVTATGTVRLTDFMPTDEDRRDVVRIVEGVSGGVAMMMNLTIRYDYGQTVPWVQHFDEGGVSAVAGPNGLVLRTAVPTYGLDLSTAARFQVREGEKESFVLTWYPSHEAPPPALKVADSLANTRRFWQEWSGLCTYRGPWRKEVMRSLITLKALTYAPTGGIVAAATTSLPEFIGGVRNWDYRYCWLRDATFTLYSFMSAGYTDEAKAWSEWLLRAAGGDPAKLQIMYGAAGERMLPEIELKHLAGYENSRPVRIGNAAASQFQLDVYGEVMDALHLARIVGIKSDEESWHLQRHIIDFVVRNWREADEGIWEIRGPRRHFTHSKVMAWVALDRGVKAVEQFGLEGDSEKWKTVRAEIHEDICQRGYHAGRKSFTQFYGGEELDASLLMLPLVGFLPANDERIVSTIDAIALDLTENGLVKRYHTQTSGQVDGLPLGEGTFLPCSFWLVDCLHLLGRKEQAEKLFKHLLALRNDLGLLAEEYDPKAARQLGNVPQAFSHVCLVNTALNLTRRVIGPADDRSAR